MSKKDKRQADVNDKEDVKIEETGLESTTGTDAEANEESAVADDIIDSPESEIETLKDLLNRKEEELKKEKKDYLFLMADFDNFRKRTIKEKSELIKTGSENVLKDLLPIVDDFERGLEAMKNADDAQALREGMELIYNKFQKFFEKNGVKEMETNGVEFDPEQHEALTTIPVDDEEKKNKIVDTITKGYTLNGKVIRHAKVMVGN